MTIPIRKVVISAFGDISNVNVVDAKIDPPPANHVQVKVTYSGFNGSDTNMRLGIYPFQRNAPLTPGYCLSGIVSACHPDSTKFKIGDRVTCLSVYDAQSTLVNLPSAHVIKIPDSVGMRESCAMTLDWNTAYGMVDRAARVRDGQRVFIHGISGAVGYALAVLCKLRGATVYGTASERNFAAIREMGATPFTYANKAWIQAIKDLGGVHAVFDALGFQSWDESCSILSPKQGGTMVGYGGNSQSLKAAKSSSSSTTTTTTKTTKPLTATAMILPVIKLFARNIIAFYTKKWTSFYYIDRTQSTFVPDLEALFRLYEQGQLPIKIRAVWDLEDIKSAHRSWGTVQGVGSLLIRVDKEAEL